MTTHNDIKVLGLGNLVRQDEGVGIHLLQQLVDILPAEIEVLDGGTGGLFLLEFVENAKRLIVLDAVEAGIEPGEIVVWKNEQVPRYMTNKLSVHQMNFAEVLYWANFQERFPDEIVVVGMQPKCMDWGTELTETVQRNLSMAIHEVLMILKDWGVNLEFRTSERPQF